MKINNTYPHLKKRISKLLLTRKIILILALIAVAVCTIVNLCTGGKLWLLYVIGGFIILYMSFLRQPLIENTFMKRFTVVIFIICGYLYLIDWLEKTNWSYFVIIIISFSVLIVQLITFLSLYDLQKKQVIPIFLTCLGSLVLMFLALFGVISLNWPIIVLSSLAIFILLLFFTIFKSNIKKELKKYFYLK